ncbi:hypothetical protein Btru_022951 [Bulinus truncatus]|nr:hypothetical protein Btru_022951 [Bulinus truncatus]
MPNNLIDTIKVDPLDCRDERQNTPLMLCVINGFCDIARLLIERGADVNCINNHGDSALILSVTNHCSTDMVKILLELNSVAIFLKNNDSDTCLSKAVERLEFEIINIILQTAHVKKSSSNYNKLYEQTICQAQCIAKQLGVLKIFNHLEQAISENKSCLLKAVSQSDLPSVDLILNYSLSRELKQPSNESLILNVLKCYEERNTGVNSTDIVIVRKLFEKDKLVTFNHYGDDNILAKAVIIGSPALLDLLCQFAEKINKIQPFSLQYVYYKGLKAACDTNKCEMLLILVQHTSDFRMPDHQMKELTRKALDKCSSDFAAIYLNSEGVVDVKESILLSVKSNKVNCFNLITEKHRSEAIFLLNDEQCYVIHAACELGNIEILGKLLELGANANLVYQDKTPLMCCRNTEIATFLIQNGADVNLKVGESHMSAILNLFIGEYFEINFYSEVSKKSSEIYNIDEIKRKLLTLFVKHGANIEDRDFKERTVLILASRLEFYERTITFLLESGADPNNVDKDGKTALHYAVSSNHSKNVETLLNFTANVNKQCHLGMTCLHVASKKGSIEIVKILLEHGADVNMEDNLGNTPLLLAVGEKSANTDVVKCLLNAKPHIDHCNKACRSALMITADKSRIDLIKLLCESGASVNMRNLTDSRNLVDILVENCALATWVFSIDVVTSIKCLLELGGNASNVRTEDLFRLISKGQIDLIQKLIHAGCSPSECPTDQSGRYTRDTFMLPTISPFCYALLENRVGLARYFKDISFLTTLDISDRERSKTIRIHLLKDEYIESLDFLDAFTHQPMSLQKMCLITVSSAIGSGIEREEKVKALPIPNKLQKRLLYDLNTDKETALKDETFNNLDFDFDPYDVINDSFDSFDDFFDSDDASLDMPVL